MARTITIDRLSYDPDTGDFVWVEPKCFRLKEGAVAGYYDAYGYRKMKWHGKNVFAHRLAWFFVFGEWPQEQIDHINGVKDDNRIANLREATYSQNGANRAAWRGGLKGASFHKKSGKWIAGIRVGGRRKHLGLFGSEEEAHQAYVEAAKSYHGEFAFESSSKVELDWSEA